MQHLWDSLKTWFLYGDIYQFTSGPIIVGGLLTLYYKHSCHVKGCFRMARHPVDGTPYVVCRKHHPRIPKDITAEHVEEIWRRTHDD